MTDEAMEARETALVRQKELLSILAEFGSGHEDERVRENLLTAYSQFIRLVLERMSKSEEVHGGRVGQSDLIESSAQVEQALDFLVTSAISDEADSIRHFAIKEIARQNDPDLRSRVMNDLIERSAEEDGWIAFDVYEELRRRGFPASTTKGKPLSRLHNVWRSGRAGLKNTRLGKIASSAGPIVAIVMALVIFLAGDKPTEMAVWGLVLAGLGGFMAGWWAKEIVTPRAARASDSLVWLLDSLSNLAFAGLTTGFAAILLVSFDKAPAPSIGTLFIIFLSTLATVASLRAVSSRVAARACPTKGFDSFGRIIELGAAGAIAAALYTVAVFTLSIWQRPDYVEYAWAEFLLSGLQWLNQKPEAIQYAWAVTLPGVTAYAVVQHAIEWYQSHIKAVDDEDMPSRHFRRVPTGILAALPLVLVASLLAGRGDVHGISVQDLYDERFADQDVVELAKVTEFDWGAIDVPLGIPIAFSLPEWQVHPFIEDQEWTVFDLGDTSHVLQVYDRDGTGIQVVPMDTKRLARLERGESYQMLVAAADQAGITEGRTIGTADGLGLMATRELRVALTGDGDSAYQGGGLFQRIVSPGQAFQVSIEDTSRLLVSADAGSLPRFDEPGGVVVFFDSTGKRVDEFRTRSINREKLETGTYWVVFTDFGSYQSESLLRDAQDRRTDACSSSCLSISLAEQIEEQSFAHLRKMIEVATLAPVLEDLQSITSGEISVVDPPVDVVIYGLDADGREIDRGDDPDRVEITSDLHSIVVVTYAEDTGSFSDDLISSSEAEDGECTSITESCLNIAAVAVGEQVGAVAVSAGDLSLSKQVFTLSEETFRPRLLGSPAVAGRPLYCARITRITNGTTRIGVADETETTDSDCGILDNRLPPGEYEIEIVQRRLFCDPVKAADWSGCDPATALEAIRDAGSPKPATRVIMPSALESPTETLPGAIELEELEEAGGERIALPESRIRVKVPMERKLVFSVPRQTAVFINVVSTRHEPRIRLYKLYSESNVPLPEDAPAISGRITTEQHRLVIVKGQNAERTFGSVVKGSEPVDLNALPETLLEVFDAPESSVVQSDANDHVIIELPEVLVR